MRREPRDRMRVLICQPLWNIDVSPTVVPRKVDGCDQCIWVPIQSIAFHIDVDHLADCRVRSGSDVPLVVQLLPKFTPHGGVADVGSQAPDCGTWIVGDLVATPQL